MPAFTHSHHKLLSLFVFFICCITHILYSTDINQSNIPFVITSPGTYNLVEDVCFGGNSFCGNHSAITIKSSNVELNLNAFSITLLHHHAIGIHVKNVSDFVIRHGSIKNKHRDSKKGSGIHIAHSRKGDLRNVTTFHSHNGLLIEKSDDIFTTDSAFFHATKEGALVKDSKAINFDNCTFTQSKHGLMLKGANRDCSIRNSDFPSSKHTNLSVQRVNGIVIENCCFSNNDGSRTKPNLVQFGGECPHHLCHDVIMRDCTVTNRPSTPVNNLCHSNTSPEGIGIYHGSGFLIDSCIVDIDNTDQDPAADLSGIHISNPGLGINGTVATNVLINNCIIQGPATNGIYPDVGSDDVRIENNLVSNASKNGIFLAGTTATTVINNTVVNNGTNGIFVGEASFFNAILNNIVSSNGFNPITSSLPPIGNGIAIASDSSSNIIQGNTVFNNAVNGIDDEGTNNRILSNTAYANVNLNYHAATDPIVISNPGDAALTGANISA